MGTADKRLAVTDETLDLLREQKPDGWTQDYFIRYLMGAEQPPDRPRAEP